MNTGKKLDKLSNNVSSGWKKKRFKNHKGQWMILRLKDRRWYWMKGKGLDKPIDIRNIGLIK